MNLVLALARSAQRHPAKTALFWGEHELTYASLWNSTQNFSSHLRQAMGVQPGHRVCLWLRNCPEFLTALGGILHAGAVAAPINNFLKPDEVGFILNDAGADVLITDAELSAAFPALKAARPGLKLFKVEELASLSSEPEAAPDPGPGSALTAESLAVLIYTSGTTGKPKGAMLSHGNLLANLESCRIVLETVETDRFAVLLPMFHSYMLTVGILLPLVVGGSIVLVKSLHPVRNAIQEIFHREASILPAIPQLYRSLVQGGPPNLGPLRLCISGAAPLPAKILSEFEEKFGIPLIEGYGLSEASPVVTKNPIHAARKPGSIGLPIPHVSVSIQDDEGRQLDHDQVGELCVRGANVMQGYWKQPEETAKVIRKGWLLTGDIGYRDTDGYYYITDRKKDMLLVNGINVYPREIEEVLYHVPGVKEAAVIGIPDARRGEQPIAFISANEGATLQEAKIQLFVKEKLADYKVPRRIVILPALPRNATGKILKTELRKMPMS
jgi:long-chain acyl-CoA synthetase